METQTRDHAVGLLLGTKVHNNIIILIANTTRSVLTIPIPGVPEVNVIFLYSGILLPWTWEVSELAAYWTGSVITSLADGDKQPA